jgi:GAF domain-containing protein/HAMP domain-containing protein
MNTLTLSLFLRRFWLFSFSIAVYFFASLILALNLGFWHGRWYGFLPIFLMIFWIVIFSVGFKWLSRRSENFFYTWGLILCLFVVGSLLIPWPNLLLLFVVAGISIALLEWRNNFKNLRAWIILAALLLYCGYLGILRWLDGVLQIQSVTLDWVEFYIIANVSVFILFLIIQTIYKYQAISIRNRLFTVNLFSFFVTLIISGLLVSSIYLSAFLNDPPKVASAFVMLLLSVLALATNLWIINISLKPLKMLARAARNIQIGQYDLAPGYDSDDEVGLVHRAFHQLILYIRNFETNFELSLTERLYDMEKHTNLVRRAAETAREICAIHDLEELLNRSVVLISEKFGYDHVLLFLVNESHEAAILTSISGYGIEDLLSKEVSVRIGSPDPIGVVASAGKPRLVKDADIQAFLPYLSSTLSRIILPICHGKSVLGVLDIHSDQRDTFSERDLEYLVLITDQMAISIANARLLHQLRTSLKELELLTGRYTNQSWKNTQRVLGLKEGYSYRGSIVRTSDTQPLNTDKGRSKARGEIVEIPLIIRNQTFGYISFKFERPDPDPVVVATLQEMVQRLALMMENARLIMEARNLAAREQQINQITAQVRNSVNVESILRNTVRELGKAFGASRTFIQIGIDPGMKQDSSDHVISESEPS